MGIEEDRLISVNSPDDSRYDRALRPKTLHEYIGQSEIVEQLEISLTAAKNRNDTLDHCLLFGPPGLGKTTLAFIIANEMGVDLHTTSGPVIEKAGDLASQLTKLKKGYVLFIDEIHRISPNIEEILYPAMEDFQLDILIGEGPAARSIKLDLPPFTLVGATTRAGLMTNPLRDRFGIIHRLKFYNHEQLAVIVERSAKLSEVPIEKEGAFEIAKRSRGTPRIANRLLRRVRDFAEVKADGRINKDIADNALNMLNVDHCGLDQLDTRMLMMIVERFNGGPVGLDTIAAALSEDKGTIEDVIEPFLLQQGFIERTPRGRIASNQTYDHFNIKGRPPRQTSLF